MYIYLYMRQAPYKQMEAYIDIYIDTPTYRYIIDTYIDTYKQTLYISKDLTDVHSI